MYILDPVMSTAQNNNPDVQYTCTCTIMHCTAVHVHGFELSQLSCRGSSVGREHGVSSFQIPPRAAFSLKKEKAVLGAYLCLLVMYI